MSRRTPSYAELEAARQALLNAQACIAIDRMHVADCELRPDGTYPIEAQHTLEEYDAVLAEIAQSLKVLEC